MENDESKGDSCRKVRTHPEEEGWTSQVLERMQGVGGVRSANIRELK